MTVEVRRMPPNVVLISIRLGDEPKLVESWLAEPIVAVVETCQRAVADDGDHVVLIVVEVPAAGDGVTGPMAAAAIAALQGLMHSLALELDASVRLNLIVVPAGKRHLADETVDYVAGDGGSWVYGSTFDLTEGECLSS